MVPLLTGCRTTRALAHAAISAVLSTLPSSMTTTLSAHRRTDRTVASIRVALLYAGIITGCRSLSRWKF
jgi:hypothetical protein